MKVCTTAISVLATQDPGPKSRACAPTREFSLCRERLPPCIAPVAAKTAGRGSPNQSTWSENETMVPEGPNEIPTVVCIYPSSQCENMRLYRRLLARNPESTEENGLWTGLNGAVKALQSWVGSLARPLPWGGRGSGHRGGRRAIRLASARLGEQLKLGGVVRSGSEEGVVAPRSSGRTSSGEQSASGWRQSLSSPTQRCARWTIMIRVCHGLC